jgi:hypothetical protein
MGHDNVGADDDTAFGGPLRYAAPGARLLTADDEANPDAFAICDGTFGHATSEQHSIVSTRKRRRAESYSDAPHAQRPDRYLDRCQRRPAEPRGRSDDGNLAVANIQTLSAAPEVSGYTHMPRARRLYTDSQMQFVPFVTYDDKGNLYVDGADSSVAHRLAELRKSAGTLTPIAFNQSIVEPTNIQWDCE